MEIHRLPIQKTNVLYLRRSGNTWIVWMNGTPTTLYSTYLLLQDNGRIERVTEGPDVYDTTIIMENDHEL